MRGHFAVGFQSREQGEECRKQCVATLQWASKVGNREKNVESSAWPARLGAPRTAIRPCSTEAHCIVSTHYFLLPPLYSLLNRVYILGFDGFRRFPVLVHLCHNYLVFNYL